MEVFPSLDTPAENITLTGNFLFSESPFSLMSLKFTSKILSFYLLFGAGNLKIFSSVKKVFSKLQSVM